MKGFLLYSHRLLYVVLFGQLLLITAGILSAQTTGTGTINGTVSDTSGAIIPNAHITLLQTSTGLTRSVTTNEKGFYAVPALRAGEYQLRAEAPGFQTFEQDAITLESDSTFSVNVRLAVGEVS
ncbi:MAG TPA: carboxypeptidase-like regulatory domain-containing protein [Acidobacteriaceae bacterium]|jgi:hypothetical protein|nr:carboxypeptidase-like regulatory domain-containing protein [Acidobacteriaceae bacterium]